MRGGGAYLGHGAEVHGAADDLVVVGNVLGRHWLMENPGLRIGLHDLDGPGEEVGEGNLRVISQHWVDLCLQLL